MMNDSRVKLSTANTRFSFHCPGRCAVGELPILQLKGKAMVCTEVKHRRKGRVFSRRRFRKVLRKQGGNEIAAAANVLPSIIESLQIDGLISTGRRPKEPS